MSAMTSHAIRFDGVSKRYRLGALEPYRTLRDTLARLGGLGSAPRRMPPGEIWALKDVSFDVKHSEVLGIVGSNGAGKSTLLKLLARITLPEAGRIELIGRVGALLEVGTGFHPELTGRENVYMNGSILGMSRRDIDRRFDEIVDFAGVDDFLDTPVKRYSSGMRVRLAFAVAAHLEPDILVVDEVLAVGDAAFQKKCLGRMADISTEGRTVLFVSHQMEAVMSLCTRAIWLDSGKVVMEGSATDTVHNYLRSVHAVGASGALAGRTDRQGSGTLRVNSITMADANGEAESFHCGADVDLSLRFDQPLRHGVNSFHVNLVVRDSLDRIVLFLSTNNFDLMPAEGTSRIVCHLQRLGLVPGKYVIDYSVWVDNEVTDKIMRAFAFEVMPGDYYRSGRVARSLGAAVFHPCVWRFEE